VLNLISFLVPKHIDIKGDKVTPNECQQKSVKMGEKKTPPINSTGRYCSLPVLLHLNKMAAQSEMQTVVKKNITGLTLK
jgi:hypothetical protein